MHAAPDEERQGAERLKLHQVGKHVDHTSAEEDVQQKGWPKGFGRIFDDALVADRDCQEEPFLLDCISMKTASQKLKKVS